MHWKIAVDQNGFKRRAFEECAERYSAALGGNINKRVDLSKEGRGAESN